MIDERTQHFNEIITNIAETLDITPTKFKDAISHFNSVKEHLKYGNYPFPDIYLQGSFRLGTVVRPMKQCKDAEYDIDVVCQIPIEKENTTPRVLKNKVGDRLKEYRLKPGEEGRRCWTLEYAEDSEGIGFHMDVLPSLPMDVNGRRVLKKRLPNSNYEKHAIEITNYDRSSKTYSWVNSGSNPRGYAQWFDDIKIKRTPNYISLSTNQKQAIYEKTLNDRGIRVFTKEEETELLVRTPLQRAIQILKRHRDIHFKNNPDYKPISIIITTLSALAYSNETDTYSALTGIIRNLTSYNRLYDVMKDTTGLIQKIDGKWHIPNPVNPAENFADRWDIKKAKAFFVWLEKLKKDFDLCLQKEVVQLSTFLFPLFGEGIVKTAFSKYGEKARTDREKGLLKMSTKSGMLGLTGEKIIKDHKFYD